MDREKELLENSIATIALEAGEAVKIAVQEAVKRSFSEVVSAVQTEGEFYKKLNGEMLSGLKHIYHEMAQNQDIPHGESGQVSDSTSQLFADTVTRLEEISKTVKGATLTIMENVETMLDDNERLEKVLSGIQGAADAEGLADALALVKNQQNRLADVLTACSFEDLTGQRLNKIVADISSIKNTVFDLYLSAGIMIKEKEANPDKNPETIVTDSKKKIEEIKNSELKGPTLNASQKDVDDLLNSLGL